MSRTVVVGDVHGCFDELVELLDKCQVTSADRIISLGDVTDRGPKIRETVDFFMGRDRPDARSMVLGNHEERQVKYHTEWLRKGSPVNPAIIDGAMAWKSDDHRSTFLGLGPRHFEWFATLPKFMRLPEYTGPDGLPITLVHAGCLPEVPLEEQTDLILMHVSNIEMPRNGLYLDGLSHGYWRPNTSTKWTSKAPPDWPFWASSNCYDGSNGHVVFGHSGFVDVARFAHATGIDLGCAFGRKLCALILPDWRFVTVDAHQEYKKNTRVKTFEIEPGVVIYS